MIDLHGIARSVEQKTDASATGGGEVKESVFHKLMEAVNEERTKPSHHTGEQLPVVDNHFLPMFALEADGSFSFASTPRLEVFSDTERQQEVLDIRNNFIDAGWTEGTFPFAATVGGTQYIINERGEFLIEGPNGRVIMTSDSPDATIVHETGNGELVLLGINSRIFVDQNGVIRVLTNYGESASVELVGDGFVIQIGDGPQQQLAAEDLAKVDFLMTQFMNGALDATNLGLLLESGFTLEQLQAFRQNFGPQTVVEQAIIEMQSSSNYQANPDVSALHLDPGQGEETNPAAIFTAGDGRTMVFDFQTGDFGIGGLGADCMVLHADGSVSMGTAFEAALAHSYLRDNFSTDTPESMRRAISDAVAYAMSVFSLASRADVASMPAIMAQLYGHCSALSALPQVPAVAFASATVWGAIAVALNNQVTLNQIFAQFGIGQQTGFGIAEILSNGGRPTPDIVNTMDANMSPFVYKASPQLDPSEYQRYSTPYQPLPR